MPRRFLVSRAASVFWVLWLLGCTCESKKNVPNEPEPPVWGCTEVSNSESLTLRASGPAVAEGSAPLFAIEVGRCPSSNTHLAVPYLDHDGKQQWARALLVDASLSSRREVDLGQVHGDAAPPQLALAADRIVFAVADNDASGESYRLGQLPLNDPAADVNWLLDVHGGQDRSPAFDVAVSAPSVVLVWDDWDSSEARGLIRMLTLTGEGPSKPMRLSSKDVDAESPRVVPRQGGYWALWSALGEAVPTPATSAETLPGASASNQPHDDNLGVLKVDRRWIQLRPLDEKGLVAGDVVDVTPRDGHVVGFDVLAGHSGSLLVAYRDGQSSPGISGGAIMTASVTPSGHVDLQPIAEHDVGAGVPTLVFDPDPDHGAPHGWVSYGDRDGEVRLVPLSPIGVPLEMGVEPKVEDGLLLAARNGVLTLARPEGRNIELFRLRCGYSSGSRPSGEAEHDQEPESP